MSNRNVSTVFKCPCGKYIVSPEGLDIHLTNCEVLLNQVNRLEDNETLASEVIRPDPDPPPRSSFAEVGNVSGVKIIEFYLPKIVLTQCVNALSADDNCAPKEVCKGNVSSEEDNPPETSTRRKSSRSRPVKRKFSPEKSDPDETWSEDDGDTSGNSVRKRRRKDRLADEQYKYECDICPNTKFLKEDKLAWHMENIHGETSKQFTILTCPICQRMFNKLLVLQSHLKNHETAEALEDVFNLWTSWPSKRRGAPAHFSCKYCMMPHFNQTSFLSHMTNQHPDKGRFFKQSCSHCDTSEFSSMKHFIVHLRKNHPEVYYGSTLRYRAAHPALLLARGHPKSRCPHCKKLFDVYYIRQHIEKKHSSKDKSVESIPPGDGTFRCPISECYALVKSQQQLKQHFILHLENNPYACPVPGCDVKCDAQCHLDRHMRLHNSKLLQCPNCKVYYSRKDKLEKHTCIWDASKLKYDQNGFLRPVNAQPRIERLPNVKQEEIKKAKRPRVSINSIISKDPVYLKVLQDNPGFDEIIFGKQGKSGNPPEKTPSVYQCQTCLAKFYDKKGLAVHDGKCVKIEDGGDLGENIGCPLCGVSFGSKKLLASHAEAIHKPEEIVKCNICHIMFSAKRSLEGHRSRFHNKYYSCIGCSKRFPSAVELDQHKLNCEACHEKCSKCDKVLANRTSLRRHWILIHGVNMEEEIPRGAGSGKRSLVKKASKKVKKRKKRHVQQLVKKRALEKELIGEESVIKMEVEVEASLDQDTYGIQVPLDIIVKTELNE